MIGIERLVDAEMSEYSNAAYADHGSARDQLQRFAALVRNEVLEEAAKEAESLWRIDGQFTADEFAAEIRALKDKK
jgi:hypothetical protein